MAFFVESSVFARVCPTYLDDDEYTGLQQFLLLKPKAGLVIPGSGGVRKLRWARSGMGKRGGLRVIYYVQDDPVEFWMLTIYSKSSETNIPAHVLRKLLEAFRDD
jgi:hypothetical protein